MDCFSLSYSLFCEKSIRDYEKFLNIRNFRAEKIQNGVILQFILQFTSKSSIIMRIDKRKIQI
jgi:hypothetical protein